MKYNKINELQEAYNELANEGDIKGALDLLEKGFETLTSEEVQTEFYDIMMDKCWLSSKCKMFDKVLETFLDLVNRGYVCPIQMQLYKEIKGYDGYKELKDKNDLLLNKLQKESKFEYVVHIPKSYSKDKKYPLFLNLHGDGDNIEYHKKYWNQEFLLSKGFIVVYPQSFQISHHCAYKWIKREFYDLPPKEWKDPTLYSSAYEDIKKIYDLVSREYSIDHENIIIGGFSGGAIASLDIATANIIPIKGVIALCSYKPKVFNQENLVSVARKGTKFIFIEGEKDVPVKDVEEMIEMCKNARIPYEYYINKGIGHWYPEDLDNKLDKALKFIME